MPGRISRRKLAEYTVDSLEAGKTKVISELAAYLIQTKRVHEAELVVRDIEVELKNRGVIIADIATAYPLTDAVKNEIEKFVANIVDSKSKAPKIHMREEVDETLLGGIRVTLPGELFDGTVKHKINALRRAKLS